MMLSKLIVTTDVPVKREKYEVVIDALRSSIVEISKKDKIFNEDDKRVINFRPPPPYYDLPIILYGQPQTNSATFEIFAYGEHGYNILNKLSVILPDKKINLKIEGNGREIEIKDCKLVDNLPFMPSPAVKDVNYYTATPLILFDKKNEFKIFFALTKEYEKNNITKDEYEKRIKEVIVDFLKNSIKNQLQKRIKPKDYSFIDTVKVDIKEFSFKFKKYHKEARPTPFLRMRFASDWLLPLFLGHHTGKGYGMILFDKERR